MKLLARGCACTGWDHCGFKGLASLKILQSEGLTDDKRDPGLERRHSVSGREFKEQSIEETKAYCCGKDRC